jgi:antitoxin HigA-1
MSMKPITPGEILLEEYLKPLEISQNALGRALGVSPRAVNEIVLGRRSITPEMSIRLGKFFGQSPRFWFGIQTNCDFRRLKNKELELTAKVRPLNPAA